MALITGPELDGIKQELVEWYQDTRQRLIKALESGYPYGAHRLSPAEQLQKFQEMTPQEWQRMRDKLAERYRGLPNQRELAEEDVRRYVAQMQRLMQGGRG